MQFDRCLNSTTSQISVKLKIGYKNKLYLMAYTFCGIVSYEVLQILWIMAWDQFPKALLVCTCQVCGSLMASLGLGIWTLSQQANCSLEVTFSSFYTYVLSVFNQKQFSLEIILQTFPTFSTWIE